MKTLVIINKNAAGGRAVDVFKSVEIRIKEAFGEFTAAMTQTPEELAGHLEAVATGGMERLIVVGGDGTNHSVINALAARPEFSVVYGCLPVGTGTDWGRALGVPADPAAAVDWLAQAQPVPCDIGKVEYLDTLHGSQQVERLFLNIASAGVSGEIVTRVNRVRRRTRLTFLRSSIATLLKYKPQRITVDCDGVRFYEGPSYLVAVANGRFFGRGMWVAPNALINDGQFDVVLVEGMPRRRILLALQTVYSGKHLERKDVHWRHASSVRIHSDEGPLGLDFEGEEGQGQDLQYTVIPGAMKILLHPASPLWGQSTSLMNCAHKV